LTLYLALTVAYVATVFRLARKGAAAGLPRPAVGSLQAQRRSSLA
jgi:hypothetical protein